MTSSVSRFFYPKKRKKIPKSARKSASLKCQNFYCFFERFRGGLLFKIFFHLNFYIYIFKFHFIKIPKTQKAPLFAVFALRAICKNRGAKKGQKAPLLREIARSGHTGDQKIFFKSPMTDVKIDNIFL